MKNIYLIINILTLLAVVSCKHEAKNEPQTDESIVEISKEQFLAENMELGMVVQTEIKEKVAFTGKIIPKISGVAKISVPVSGKIISVNIKEGQHINANEILLKVGGSELIDLQQAFASSSAKIKHLKSDYDKAKQLFEENIKTESEYMLAESNYKVEWANYSALKAKLQNIGLNLKNIEKGEYASQYSIKSPIAGQVSEMNIVSGQHVSSETEIVEIIDNNKIELHLTIFEKDFSKMLIGQIVQFWAIDNSTSKSLAKISRIGGKLNTNTIDCFASISDRTNTYAINQIVNGEITVSSDSVPAIYKNAVFTIGNNHYILIKKSEVENKYKFEKKKIRTGKSSGDYIELLEMVDEEILMNGTYNISIE
jgi:cobalt-zinc-cadmium efflux system membrane fusion protein